jgi:hypothetical protein
MDDVDWRRQMVIRIPRRFLVVALAAGLLVGGGVPGAAAAAAKPTAGAGAGSVQRPTKRAKKPKRVKCRKSQVAIKVNRRTVACRSRRAALPLPKPGDSRLLYARFALADNLAGLRDRRGRRPRSLKKLFRKANPHAWAAVQSGLRRGLGRLDKMAAARPALARISDGPRLLARRNPECSRGDLPTQSEAFASNAHGEKVTVAMSAGREQVLELGLESDEFEIHLRLTDGSECHRFDAPTCPTAAGVVDATDSSLLRFAISVAKHGEVLVNKSVSFAGNTTMHAEVGEDAKLAFIDIDDSQTANIDLGDRRQSFGPVSLNYTGLHRTRVRLPGRTYDSSHSAVDIAFTERGMTFGKSQLGRDTATIARSLDQKFAELVANEIANFEKLEAGWNEPNKCVRVEFNPVSMTRTLHRGEHGTFSAQAVALEGGGASPGHWLGTPPENASVTEKAEGANPQLSYDVTNAGKDIFVKAGYRVTSKAGVGEATWTQPTEDAPRYRGTVSGTRRFQEPGDCGRAWHWSYSARLATLLGTDQPFAILELDPGSGIEGGTAQAYDETGSGSYTLDPCRSDPGCSTGLARDPGFGPGLVSFSVDADTVTADVDASDFTGACPHDWSRFLGRGTFPRSSIGADAITVTLAWNDGSSGTLTLTRAN